MEPGGICSIIPQMRSGASGVFLCIAGKSTDAGWLECRRWVAGRARVARTGVRGRGWDEPAGGSNSPEMEYWGGGGRLGGRAGVEVGQWETLIYFELTRSGVVRGA